MKYSSTNKPIVCMMTNSTCYKGTKKMTPKGILWHSTGANNPNLKRYVQPSENDSNYENLISLLGINKSKNDWNHKVRQAGLNAWIGKLVDGTVATVQTMPWNYKPWGCGNGTYGSCNDGWIQFEICEDDLTNQDYFNKVYKEACELTAYLCKEYNLDPIGIIEYKGHLLPTILCHADSHKFGFGSNHGDIYTWFNKYGKNMDTVREDVCKLLGINFYKEEEYKEENDMAVTICHASISENGNAGWDGKSKAGDQTGKEVCTRAWYNKSWNFVARYPDATIRAKAAEIAKKLAKSNLVGYDQSQRNTLYQALKKNNFDVDKYIASKVKTETDCSAFMYACYACVLPSIRSDSNAPATSGMKSAYEKFGFQILTASKYLTSDNYLVVGDVIVRSGHHTAMAITKGSKVTDSAVVSTTISTTTTATTYNKNTVLKATNSIKGVQTYLNTYYLNALKKVGSKLDVDGEWGPKSQKALTAALQWELNAYGASIDIDGDFGSKSQSAWTDKVGTLKSGSKNIFVTFVQMIIVSKGITLSGGIDGDWGSGTTTGVNTLLGKVGLSKDSNITGTDINTIL